VEQAGATVRRWLFRDQQGEVLCDIDLEAPWGAVGPFIGVERARLQDALLTGAPAASRRVATWVTTLSQEGRCVAVGFSDGTAGEYDLVVGADGISSTVRELAISAAGPVYSGQMAWRSLAPIRPGEPAACSSGSAMDVSSDSARWATGKPTASAT
jgi:2-polyprenyl-6-methoxyphenol hydroxylase-like FAD-dependent oxidoreductase